MTDFAERRHQRSYPRVQGYESDPFVVDYRDSRPIGNERSGGISAKEPRQPNAVNGKVRKPAMRPALWVVGDPALPPLRRRNSELRPREYLTPAVFGPVRLHVPLPINAGPRAEIALAHLTSRVARAEATGMPARDNKVQPPRTGRPLPPGAVQTTWVTGRKTRSEYMFSALPQIADIARSEFHNSANQPYCLSRVLRIMRSGR